MNQPQTHQAQPERAYSSQRLAEELRDPLSTALAGEDLHLKAPGTGEGAAVLAEFFLEKLKAEILLAFPQLQHSEEKIEIKWQIKEIDGFEQDFPDYPVVYIIDFLLGSSGPPLIEDKPQVKLTAYLFHGNRDRRVRLTSLDIDLVPEEKFSRPTSRVNRGSFSKPELLRAIGFKL